MVQQTKEFVQQKKRQLTQASATMAKEYGVQQSVARVHLREGLETLRKDPYADVQLLKSNLRIQLFREYMRIKKYEEWFTYCRDHNYNEDTYIRGLALIQKNQLLPVNTIKKRLQKQMKPRTPQIHPVGKSVKSDIDTLFPEF